MKTYFPPLRSVYRSIFTLTLLSSLGASITMAQTVPQQIFPDAPVAVTGTVTVKMTPAGIASGWHFVGEKGWRESGTQLTGLVLGEREIEFRPIPDFIQPLNLKINLTSVSPNVTLTRTYFESTGGETGRLTVIIKPNNLAAGSVPLKKRAQWRLVREGGDEWRDSGESRKLLPGNYLVETKPVTGKTTPQPISVTVLANKNPSVTAVYFDQDSTIGVQPEVLDFSSINDSAAKLPYAFVGQIRTSHSQGTGCVVLDRTVATAAHLIYDEDKLAYFGGLEWLFQRHKGIHDSLPMIPRRVGILTSYADQRDLDDSPGRLSARARNCDVAALYFQDSPGRNGFSGYQFSTNDDDENNIPNEFLTSANLKTLVCYPIEKIPAPDLSKMHATTSSNFRFTANPALPGPPPNSIYSTTDFTSVGGSAGAPVFVRNNSGVYHCAAIYLGSSTTTEVRSFTSDVNTLFLWANNDGVGPDGGITQIDGPITGGGFVPGAIKITLKPSSGRWKLGKNGTARPSGTTVSNLLPGKYAIHFTTIAGHQKLDPISVEVRPGALASKTVKYARLGPFATSDSR